MSISTYFSGDSIDLDGLGTYLDGLDHGERLASIRKLSGKQMSQLFDAAEEAPAVTLEHFVATNQDTLAPVVHHGLNSLPVFRQFEKRFCKPTEAAQQGDQLWGYNEQSMRWITGPGYFVAREAERGGIVLDYYLVPSEKPKAWPTIQANEKGLSRLVYAKMRDYMRRVSEHVTVGQVERNGRPENNWFVLCREDTGQN